MLPCCTFSIETASSTKTGGENNLSGYLVKSFRLNFCSFILALRCELYLKVVKIIFFSLFLQNSDLIGAIYTWIPKSFKKRVGRMWHIQAAQAQWQYQLKSAENRRFSSGSYDMRCHLSFCLLKSIPQLDKNSTRKLAWKTTAWSFTIRQWQDSCFCMSKLFYSLLPTSRIRFAKNGTR